MKAITYTDDHILITDIKDAYVSIGSDVITLCDVKTRRVSRKLVPKGYFRGVDLRAVITQEYTEQVTKKICELWNSEDAITRKKKAWEESSWVYKLLTRFVLWLGK